jgi:hypothetical protein
MKRTATICLVTAFATLGALNLLAADTKPAPAEKAKAEKKAPASLPFHGTLDGVDKTAMTIKVGERTFQVTSKTKISKAGKPATFDDAQPGEEVAGAYAQGEGGKLNLISLRFGPKPVAAEKKKPAK